MSTQLNLRVHKVTCTDETGGAFAEKFGHDEIFLGGFSMDAFASVTKINPIAISSSFDDGEEKKYNPPRIIATFRWGANVNKPRLYAVGFLLMAKNHGKMADAVTILYNKVLEESGKHKAESTDATAQDSAVATEPPPPIWPQIKTVVQEFVKSNMIGKLGDKIFPFKEASVTIENASHTWNGKTSSPLAMIQFSGNDGIYQITYDWELK